MKTKIRKIERIPVQIGQRYYDDFEDIENLLKATNNFSLNEIDIAFELIEDTDYNVKIIDVENELAGFVIWGQTPATEGTYDMYWLAVHPKFHGQGIAKQIEEYLVERVKHAGGYLIYVETSSRESYDRTRAFYEKQGYQKLSQVKDYYKRGEDLVTYGKWI